MRLLLLRHGKAAWPDGVDDMDRPLARRGREAARRMGAYLAEEGLVPDLALVSPARRTEETWALVKPALAGVPARSEPRIYEAPAERLMSVVAGVEPAVGTLLLVGHNPGLEELLRLLIPAEERYAQARLRSKFPTAGLAVVDVRSSRWDEIARGAGSLQRFVTPRSLGWGEDE
jgi:phosphohistidine phosphatase